MQDMPEQRKDTAGSVLGGLTSVIVGDLGGAIAVIGGLYTGFRAINAAERLAISSWSWSLYLIAGAIFVAIAVICRWRPRR